MKRIGILGGTFDPPHYGHLLIAEEVLEQCKLDEIWFMPSHIPPHKEHPGLSLGEDRKEMVERAIDDNDRFFLCDIELTRKGRSYTIDTIKQLKEDCPTIDFYFIIGGDMIDYLPKWVSIDELMNLVTFIGVKRPGALSNSAYSKQIIEVDVPQLAISSSLIRKKVINGQTVRYLLPENVRNYIMERGLYG